MTTDIATIEAKLSEFDIILLIDKSGSMEEDDCPSGMSRWAYVQESAVALARRMCKIDTDGIGLVLFSGTGIEPKDNCDVSVLKDMFAKNHPGGSTPLHSALEAGLKLAGKSDKKDLLVVFTDGAPDDAKAVINVITAQAEKQTTDDECTILFIQVGRDPKATAYLKKLDDDLNTKFDIVDVKTIDEADKYASVEELLFDAING